jgi:hypothetical protein
MYFKGRTNSSSSEDIRPLSEAGPRKIQNVNKKKRTTAILTDTPSKMFKKTTTQVFEQMSKPGPKKIGKRSVCNVSTERFTKGTLKNFKKPKNAGDTK